MLSLIQRFGIGNAPISEKPTMTDMAELIMVKLNPREMA